MLLDLFAAPSGAPEASGAECVAVRTFSPAHSDKTCPGAVHLDGIASFVDEALTAARSWIASELFLDERVAAACASIRLAPTLSEALQPAAAACRELCGAEGCAILLREECGLRVASSVEVPDAAVAALEGFGSAGSSLLPSSGFAVADLAEGGASPADFLSIGLQRAGVRGFAAFPLRLDGRDGAAFICMTSRMPIGGGGDMLRRMHRAAARVADSIERRGAADAIAMREASLRAIVDSVVEGIVTVDSTGRIRSANPAAGRIFGCPADELVGRHVDSFFSEGDRERLSRALAVRVRGESRRASDRSIALGARRRDGSEVAVELALSEVEPGRLYTGVVRDVSERRAEEARIRQSDRMASLGALAAGLGHDMNNVLFPIRAHLNALASEAADAPAGARLEHVEQIGSGIRYLQQLADGLHYLVNDHGHADGGRDGAVLAEWWRGTGALLSRSLPALTQVEVDVPADLPRVRITEHAPTQAVLNIFVNAGEAIATVRPGPEGRVRISAHAAPDGRSIALSVCDNGPGMDEPTRRRAFDMFFTTKVRGLGSGLGLAMVNRVLREAGGDALIESAPGSGATVTLRIPVATEADELAGVRVAICGMDGRAIAFVRSALAARGAIVVAESGVESADAWFVDPRLVEARTARAWRLRGAARTLVLLGLPPRAQRAGWSGLADCAIRPITDFDALLAGVGRACSIIQRRRNHDRDTDRGGAGAAGTHARQEEGDQPVDRARAGGGARARRR